MHEPRTVAPAPRPPASGLPGGLGASDEPTERPAPPRSLWPVLRPIRAGRTTAVQMERALLAARWGALALGVVRLTFYPTDAQAPGLLVLLWVLIAATATFNVVLARQLGRGDLSLIGWAFGTTAFLIDVAVLGTFATAFWDTPAMGATWPVLLLVVVESVFRYQLLGIVVGPGVALLIHAVATAVSPNRGPGLRDMIYRGGFFLVVAFLGSMLARANAKARDDLRTALAEIRDVDRWRQRMVDVLAHDVRGPAGTVVATAELLQLRDTELDAETRQALLASLARQGRRVQLLAADLLDMSRLDRRRFRLEPASEDLVPALQGVVDATPGDGVRLEAPEQLVAQVDRARVEQIVANLLTNATRYGAPPIVVRADRDDRAVVLQVRDHGPGVPAAERDDLFSPFTAGDHAGSTGLGLWIVHELTRAHGGTVAYEDADPGARFTVTLPDLDPAG